MPRMATKPATRSKPAGTQTKVSEAAERVNTAINAVDDEMGKLQKYFDQWTAAYPNKVTVEIIKSVVGGITAVLKSALEKFTD